MARALLKGCGVVSGGKKRKSKGALAMMRALGKVLKKTGGMRTGGMRTGGRRHRKHSHKR